MDVTDEQESSQLEGASKLFEERLQEQTFMIQGIPGFITTTHRGKCSTCEMYAAHTIVAARCLTVAIPSHQIEHVFHIAWTQVVTHIEDEAMDEAHGKLSWYWNRYEDKTKSIKALEEKLSSERDHHHKVEMKQSKLKTELKSLQMEV